MCNAGRSKHGYRLPFMDLVSQGSKLYINLGLISGFTAEGGDEGTGPHFIYLGQTHIHHTYSDSTGQTSQGIIKYKKVVSKGPLDAPKGKKV